jgi:probable phosphoglycerate mutase
VESGYYVLNTDGGRHSSSGLAAIGVVLQTPHLVTLEPTISRTIGHFTHNVAEYRGLIEGLKLAREHGVEQIRVYMDSQLVVDQVNGVSKVKKEHLAELHREAGDLVAVFKNIRICWVPREWNIEADQLVRDALAAASQNGSS